jgi:hypothetical protein
MQKIPQARQRPLAACLLRDPLRQAPVRALLGALLGEKIQKIQMQKIQMLIQMHRLLLHHL